MSTIRISKKKSKTQFAFWETLLRTQIKDFEPNSITININQRYEPHTHQRQTKSYIILLGDFEGGSLCLEDGTKFNEKNKFLEFDGGKKHWVEDWTGNRISIVFYYKKPQSEFKK